MRTAGDDYARQRHGEGQRGAARIIKAEAELEASQKLGDAAEQMAKNPVAVELRRMQMVTEVGAENNSISVLMIPSDFVTLAKIFTRYLDERASRRSKPSNPD
jgi:regulator of protease activity HflC (stomatin/prohibitin superfamily)